MATTAQKIAKRGGDYISARTTLSLPVTATANTDYAAISLPAGAIDVAYKTITTTAYTAGTDAKVSIGSTAGGVDYVAAVSIAAIAVVTLTPVNAAAAVHLTPGALTFFVRVTQTGTATAVGSATLIFTYGLPVS